MIDLMLMFNLLKDTAGCRLILVGDVTSRRLSGREMC